MRSILAILVLFACSLEVSAQCEGVQIQRRGLFGRRQAVVYGYTVGSYVALTQGVQFTQAQPVSNGCSTSATNGYGAVTLANGCNANQQPYQSSPVFATPIQVYPSPYQGKRWVCINGKCGWQ